MTRTLWIDESARVGAQGGVLVLAGVEDLSEGASAERLNRLLLPGQRYIHWRDESAVRRHQIVSVLNELSISAVIVVVEGFGPRELESARSACVLQLVGEVVVGRIPVDRLAFERRAPHLNQRDTYTFINAARSGLAVDEIDYEFVRKSSSPLLWAADAFASMASARFAEHGGSDHWWRALRLRRLTTLTANPKNA